MESYLVAPSETVEAHRKATAFADDARIAVEERIGDYHGRFAASALTSIQVDSEALHGAILSLCEGGWAFATPILHRTSLELVLSALVIGHGEGDREYLGFKYTRAYLNAASHDAQRTEAERTSAREELQAELDRLPADMHAKAEAWATRGKVTAFWYQDEFEFPVAVIKAYGTPEIREQYRALSAPTHGGVLGLRIFRSEPDRVHSRPRRDPLPQGEALVLSSWFLTAVTEVMATYHALSVHQVATKLRSEQREILAALGDRPHR